MKNVKDNPEESNPVHTPTPPQVMDPSQPLKQKGQRDRNEENKEGRKKSGGKKTTSGKNKPGREKLTPSEEL